MLSKLPTNTIIAAATILTWTHVLAGPIESGANTPTTSDNTSVSPPSLEAAAAVDGHLYACVHANWVQPCKNFAFIVNKCYNFDLLYLRSVSSIRPDRGFRCVLYQGLNCTAHPLSIGYPGLDNLDGTGFNDNLSAFNCFRGN